MTARESDEGFAGVALRHIAPQQSYEERRKVSKGHILDKLTPQSALLLDAPAHIDVIALRHCVTPGNLGPEQSDVCDKVLRTRMWTSRQMNVDRHVQLYVLLQMPRQIDRLRLGVGR